MSAPRPGDRIRLIAMPDDPDPIPSGSMGTVTAVRQHRTWNQMDVAWDNGRTLMVSVPPDQFEVVRGHGEAQVSRVSLVQFAKDQIAAHDASTNSRELAAPELSVCLCMAIVPDPIQLLQFPALSTRHTFLQPRRNSRFTSGRHPRDMSYGASRSFSSCWISASLRFNAPRSPA
jgi:hypothetical protein